MEIQPDIARLPCKKSMHWILQHDIFSEAASKVLVETLERFGLPHSFHKVVPFVGELLPDPDIGHNNVICIGSYSMRHVARKRGWSPGVFDLAEQDFRQQMRHWGGRMLNAGSVVSRFGDAVFTGEALFVRPCNDTKYFAGRVFSREEFTAWQRSVCALGLDDESSLTPDTLIQLARPLEIYAEYRYWVVRGRIVTSSLYKRGDKVIYSGDVAPRIDAYVMECLEEWMPHEAFVIDVCDTPEGIRIVEINTLNASGFYAGDMQRLVLALEEAYDTQS